MVLYTASNTRSRLHDEVRDESAGTETFLMDTQGLKLAYGFPDGIYQKGSILYIARTKSGRDVYDDLKLPEYKTQQTEHCKDVDMFIRDGFAEIDVKKH